MHPQHIKHILHPGCLDTFRLRNKPIPASRIVMLEK